MTYDINKLDLNNNNIKKDWCLANVKIMFGMSSVNMGPDANTALRFIDKTDFNTYQVWDVLVIGANSPVFASSVAGTTYWHIWVITAITDKIITMSDGKNAYPALKLNIEKIKGGKHGAISPRKMIAIGAKRITMEDLVPKQNYKEIFQKEFPNGSTVFTNEEALENALGSQQAYAMLIGFERVKQYGDRHNTSLPN